MPKYLTIIVLMGLGLSQDEESYIFFFGKHRTTMASSWCFSSMKKHTLMIIR